MTSAQPAEPLTYPFAAEKLNLAPLYAQLRREEPLTRVQLPYGEPAWLATRYEDARLVLGDPRFSRAAAVGRDAPRVRPYAPGPGTISTFDPPEHSRLRRLVTKAFTVRQIDRLRPRVQRIADELVDAIRADGAPADLVEDFALPLPITVICELLGVPFEDRADFRLWSEAFLSTTKYTLEEIKGYRTLLRDYMADLAEQRRTAPQEDLLSSLVAARENDDRLSEDELLSLSEAILIAGHETTATQLANFLYVLLTQPDHLAALRADLALVPQAVEELLRFTPLGSGSMQPRYAREDVEMGGVTVRAGEPVVVAINSANRDESVYTDSGQLDLCRREATHLGFGHGPHHCLGAPLARMELQIALRTLLERLPGLRFADAERDVEWKVGVSTRGVRRLPVTWEG
ncbi:cytochrome P450 [Streptomyces sp. NPDC021212]|uniref:cytochrome P450 n=1 Tax=Streptomyces sp. NPDC021212 TaxID=3365118 RepID=UPI00379ED04D